MSGPKFTSWRRACSAITVSGKSIAIRAGSSIVKLMGSGAAELVAPQRVTVEEVELYLPPEHAAPIVWPLPGRTWPINLREAA